MTDSTGMNSVTMASPGLSVWVNRSYSIDRKSRFALEARFDASPGVTALLGHSGAGKSTLLRCIAGLCTPDRGRISIGPTICFDSEQKINVEPARRGIAFVFQDLALFPHLTVQENVAYGIRRLNAVEREQRMDAILRSFQITDLRNRLPHEISGGEQQRVALARSLITYPAVLLLDEPLSSLDPRTKGGIIDDLYRWNEAHRIPVLWVTHDPEEAFALADKAIIFENGRIAAEGSPLNIVPSPRRETVAQSDGFENIFDAIVTSIKDGEGTLTCRLINTSLELEVPLTRVRLGARVRLGISASEILLASSRPEIVGACNVVRGKIKGLEPDGNPLYARVECGTEFRVGLPQIRGASSPLNVSDEIWMIIQALSCHLMRAKDLNLLQRLFVFVCGGNTNRSPMAQAICNAQMAKHLRIPLDSLSDFGIRALSAGLSVHPKARVSKEAQNALAQMGIPALKHEPRQLDRQIVDEAEAIFCMTEGQRQAATAMFPHAFSKIHRLWPNGDIADPSDKDQTVFSNLAEFLAKVIGDRIGELITIG